MGRDRKRGIPGHRVPAWFEDAKLGIFIHWGVFSVPAWAPLLPAGETMPDLVRRAPREMGALLPYAEWYANAARIAGSPTALHHAATYGDAPYEDFRATFEGGLADWDPDEWAARFAAAGAGYVVLVTKHHDGYCLWPTDVANPRRPGWHSSRDLVGELAAAVRRRGLRFGVYYSAGLDWTWEDRPIVEPLDMFAAVPRDPAYVAYVDAHLRELVDRYRPSIVWNDIASPPGFDLRSFLTYYLERVPDGTTNDRWHEPPPLIERDPVRRMLNSAAAVALPRLPARPIESAPLALADFRTPEYSSPPEARTGKWETTRGMGAAFGHNANEPDDRLIDADELVRSLVDAVAKNGNMLLNVGPDARGRILDREQVRLDALGEWMERAGSALRGTRPWVRAEATTAEGIDVRFTQGDGAINAVLLARPEPGAPVTLRGLGFVADRPVELLGHGLLEAEAIGPDLRLTWPTPTPIATPAPALRLGDRVERGRRPNDTPGLRWGEPNGGAVGSVVQG